MATDGTKEYVRKLEELKFTIDTIKGNLIRKYGWKTKDLWEKPNGK